MNFIIIISTIQSCYVGKNTYGYVFKFTSIIINQSCAYLEYHKLSISNQFAILIIYIFPHFTTGTDINLVENIKGNWKFPGG